MEAFVSCNELPGELRGQTLIFLDLVGQCYNYCSLRRIYNYSSVICRIVLPCRPVRTDIVTSGVSSVRTLCGRVLCLPWMTNSYSWSARMLRLSKSFMSRLPLQMFLKTSQTGQRTGYRSGLSVLRVRFWVSLHWFPLQGLIPCRSLTCWCWCFSFGQHILALQL